MSRLRKRIISGCGALALLAGSHASADSLRCGSRVVSQGDHAAKLLRYCGDPVSVRTWVIERSVISFGTVFRPGIGLSEEVLVEEWVYNFGPRKLMRRVRIENGLVRDVRELGYGFRE